MSHPGVCLYLSRVNPGITAGNDEFQQAVHRAVPDGHTFKGYPVQLVHRNVRRAFNSCLKSVYAIHFLKLPKCLEILRYVMMSYQYCQLRTKMINIWNWVEQGKIRRLGQIDAL